MHALADTAWQTFTHYASAAGQSCGTLQASEWFTGGCQPGSLTLQSGDTAALCMLAKGLLLCAASRIEPHT